MDEQLGYSKYDYRNKRSYMISRFQTARSAGSQSKFIFPTDNSLLKMLYLAMIDITKKWTGNRQDWGQIHSQLEIFFEERLFGL